MSEVSYEYLGEFFKSGRNEKFFNQIKGVYFSVKRVVKQEIEHFYFKGMLDEEKNLDKVEFYAFTDKNVVIIAPKQKGEKVIAVFTAKKLSDIETVTLGICDRYDGRHSLSISFSDGTVIEMNAQEDSNSHWLDAYCEAIEQIYQWCLEKMS